MLNCMRAHALSSPPFARKIGHLRFIPDRAFATERRLYARIMKPPVGGSARSATVQSDMPAHENNQLPPGYGRKRGISMSFRDNLQHLRAERNMTQEQLAMLLGVFRQSVTKWEADASRFHGVGEPVAYASDAWKEERERSSASCRYERTAGDAGFASRAVALVVRIGEARAHGEPPESSGC